MEYLPFGKIIFCTSAYVRLLFFRVLSFVELVGSQTVESIYFNCSGVFLTSDLDGLSILYIH